MHKCLDYNKRALEGQFAQARKTMTTPMWHKSFWSIESLLIPTVRYARSRPRGMDTAYVHITECSNERARCAGCSPSTADTT
jgi:hypothetical protein